MRLTHLLMRRAVWISLVCLGVAFALALWRAQVDMGRESRSAVSVAELMGRLSALHSVAPEKLTGELSALKRLSGEDSLRHVRFRIEDGQGREVVASPIAQDAGPSWLERWHGAPPPQVHSWQVERADGMRFRVTLEGNPASEGQEASTNILGLGLILAFYALILLLGLNWAVKRAFEPMHNILQAIHSWEEQDYQRRLPSYQVEELDRIGGALNHLAAALEHSQAARRQLSLRVHSLQEDERARLARELHDDFAQSVTALRADAAWLSRKLAPGELREVAEGLGRQCAQLHEHMRGTLRRLRPLGGMDEEELDLPRLIEGLVRDWQGLKEQTVRCRCEVDLAEKGSCLNPALALCLFRLSQEALTNGARHAGPCELLLSIRIEAGPILIWEARDTGRGLSDLDQALNQGNGLAGMRERVWAHGGAITFSTGPGLTIQARFPLETCA